MVTVRPLLCLLSGTTFAFNALMLTFRMCIELTPSCILDISSSIASTRSRYTAAGMRPWVSTLLPAALTSLFTTTSSSCLHRNSWDAPATNNSRRTKLTFVSTTARALGRRSSAAGGFVGGLGHLGDRTRHYRYQEQQQQDKSCIGGHRSGLLPFDTNNRIVSGRNNDGHSHRQYQPFRATKARGRGGSFRSIKSSSSGETSWQSKEKVAVWPPALSQARSRSSGNDKNSGIGIAETVKQAAQWLELHEVVDPEPSASELLAKAVGYRSPREMLSQQQRITNIPGEAGKSLVMSVAQWDEFRRLCVLRAAQHVPVQYLVGEWDFYGLSLEMQPPTLIPRPETEELVEIILNWLRQDVVTLAGNGVGGSEGGRDKALRFLDVGSGTGAIGLALLNELPVEARCVAIDAQQGAVRLSQRNAERTGLKERYSCFHAKVEEFGFGLEPSSSCETNPPEGSNSAGYTAGDADNTGGRSKGTAGQEENTTSFEPDGSFDFVVSNPPYIPRRDMDALPKDVANHEDSVALDGGEDGLDVIRDIVRRCPRLLKRGGPRQLWMEVDTSHPEAIQRWLGLPVGLGEGTNGTSQKCQSYGVTRFEWMRDMSQRPRFVRLTFAEGESEE